MHLNVFVHWTDRAEAGLPGHMIENTKLKLKCLFDCLVLQDLICWIPMFIYIYFFQFQRSWFDRLLRGTETWTRKICFIVFKFCFPDKIYWIPVLNRLNTVTPHYWWLAASIKLDSLRQMCKFMTPTSSVQNVNWGKKLLHKRMQGKYPIFNILDRAAEFLLKI